MNLYQLVKDDGVDRFLKQTSRAEPTHSINTSLGLQQQISIGAKNMFLNRFCFLKKVFVIFRYYDLAFLICDGVGFRIKRLEE